MMNLNNLKRIGLILPILMLAQTLYASYYLVYSVIGDVKLLKSSKSVTLSARRVIHSDSRLVLGKESAVTVIDELNSKLYSFTTPGTHTVKSLLDQAKEGENPTKQYVSYLVKQLFSKESRALVHPSSYMQVAAVAYRSTSTDSLLLNKLSYMISGHQSPTVEEALLNPQTQVIGDLDVRFELISCSTNQPLSKEVEKNTSCYVRAINETNHPVYVNIIDIDERGNKYLVLPVDKAALCAHLLVPARATVSFISEPFVFVEEKSKDAFLLVATEEPIDFSILMSPIKGNQGKHLKSGLYRNIYETK